MQDLIRLKNWTISAGLRWDHYQLLVEPASGGSALLDFALLSLRRPARCISPTTAFFKPRRFENILLSNSTAIVSLDPTNFLRLPVQPSEGNYYEAGVTKAFFGKDQGWTPTISGGS